MSTVVVATSAADAQAVEAVKNHHAQLAGALAVKVEALVDSAARSDLPGAGAASDALVRWCDAELVPHALAEEQAMYPAAHEDLRARLLVDAMLAEHRDLVSHAIRHATIFGALDSVGAGSGMVLVAPHDPLPLLAQLEQRSPGLFTVDYLERGPESWRVRFVRD